MPNGNGLRSRTGDALVDWEFEKQKEMQLEARQAGKVHISYRPLSRRHCLVVALILASAALAILFVFTKFMTR